MCNKQEEHVQITYPISTRGGLYRRHPLFSLSIIPVPDRNGGVVWSPPLEQPAKYAYFLLYDMSKLDKKSWKKCKLQTQTYNCAQKFTCHAYLKKKGPVNVWAGLNVTPADEWREWITVHLRTGEIEEPGNLALCSLPTHFLFPVGSALMYGSIDGRTVCPVEHFRSFQRRLPPVRDWTKGAAAHTRPHVPSTPILN